VEKKEASSKHEWGVPYYFSLGGYDQTGPENVNLFWQSNQGPPQKIDQIAVGSSETKSPFALKSGCHRFDLVTPHVDDPLTRVRLVKDLLAEVLRRFKNKTDTCILAVDSLSALLAEISQTTSDDSHHTGRRLHILNFVRWLEENRVTTLMSTEAHYDTGPTEKKKSLFVSAQERYIASGVIELNYHQYRSADLMRYLRIMKMRGAAHDMRPYAYDLRSEGIVWLEPMVAEPEGSSSA